MKVNNGVLTSVREEDIPLLVDNPTKFFKGVYKIGKEAFRDVNLKELYDIVIPGTVNIIDDLAFDQCEWIRNVRFGKGLTLIGKKAFSECTNLENIVLPDELKVIEEDAFYNCENVTKIFIGKGDISIDDSSFSGNYKNLKSIHIDANIKGIGNRVLFDCCRHEIVVSFGNYLSEIGASLFGERNDIRELTIPNNVTDINDSAFTNLSRLKKVTFGESLEYIGRNAFSGCTSLYRLKIPGSVHVIDKAAFSCCLELRELIIENGIQKHIGPEAFWMCSSLRKVSIPNSVSSIGDSAFYCCTSLSSINFEEGITQIGAEAFVGCSSLEYLYLPSSVKIVKALAFSSCDKLESVTLSKNMLDVEEGLFTNCKSLKRVIIPEGVKYIRKGAFKGCTSLEEIFLPNSIAVIDEEVFADCPNLRKVVLGNDIRRIAPNAFDNCPNLTDVLIPEKAKSNLNYIPSKERKNTMTSPGQDMENKSLVNEDFAADFKTFDDTFKNIFGQDEAIETIRKSLLRNVLLHSAIDIESGSNEKRKGPLATFMFYGPTGTGKTELSKRMAKFMFNDSEKLLILDMNTYKDPKLAVSSIKGHPEGYIDSSKGTDFTRFLSKNKSGVIVLDEFEKANPEVREIFMTMLDEGVFKDALGNVYDLSNYIFVATTNISKAFESQKSSKKIGFSFNEDEEKRESHERIKGVLREEFTAPILNRFNNLVAFEKIDEVTAKKIAKHFMAKTFKMIEGKEFRGKIRPKITIEDKEDVIKLVLEQSNYTKDGARSIKNVVEDIVMSPILQEIANGKYNIVVKVTNNKIVASEKITRTTI